MGFSPLLTSIDGTDCYMTNCFMSKIRGNALFMMDSPLYNLCENNYITSLVSRGGGVQLSSYTQISVMDKLVPLVQLRGDTERASRYQRHAVQLKQSIEAHARDGEWYVRAFNDSGHPWGSHSNEECRIDAIAQAWSALSGFGDEQRTLQALTSTRRFLVDKDQHIVRLLTPPFDQSARNPGYIKAYPPGIRENGGQYSREPYVVSADIGGESPQTGRGGWSWYTGTAGWGHRLAVHGLLGIHYGPSKARILPRVPTA
jgi:cyclic beta-1,2-glucan synthetase